MQPSSDRSAAGPVLVTGATGFLGSAVATALARAGFDVRRGTRVAPPRAGDEVWVGYGDIGPDTQWRAALQGIGTIVHLAGLAHLPDGSTAAAAQAFKRINADGTARLAAAAVESGVRRFVLLSSALVHGHASTRPLRDADAPRPGTTYASSKLEGEQHLQGLARGSGLQWVILRPPMVYGANARGNFLRLVSMVRSGLPIPLGAATAPKSFIGVDNLADAVVRSVEHEGIVNRAFLVADAETTSTAHFIHRIAAALQRRVMVPRVPATVMRHALRVAGREADYMRLFEPLQIDASGFRDALGWSPPLTMDEGLRRAVAGDGLDQAVLRQRRSLFPT